MSQQHEDLKQVINKAQFPVPFCLIALFVGACAEGDAGVAAAETFLDAFYRWDRDAAQQLLQPGPDADRVLYYQGWAEAANYRVLNRQPCRAEGDAVICAVTVTDDFGSALGYTATDTFTLQVQDGLIVGINFAGDDPPVFEAVFEWLSAERPEVFSGPCLAMFEGGTTPGDCARAIAQGARDYVAANPGALESP